MMERVTSRDLTTATVSTMLTPGATITNTGIELRARTLTTTKSFRRRPPKRPRRDLRQKILKHFQMCKKARSRNTKKLRHHKA